MKEIEFHCPHCGQPIKADAEMAGTPIDCPACKKPILVEKKKSKYLPIFEGGLAGVVVTSVIVLVLLVVYFVSQNKALQQATRTGLNTTQVITQQVSTAANPPVPLSPQEQLIFHAKSGDAEAQYTLGLKYLRGDGIEKNTGTALIWLQKSAESGLIKAQAELGFLYTGEEGVTKSSSEAARWLKAAADKGDAGSSNNLGLLYETGDGVRQDKDTALKLYATAAQQGCADGTTNYNRLLHTMWLEVLQKEASSGNVAQECFDYFHPVGTAKQLVVDDLQIHDGRADAFYSLAWVGPIIQDGHTRFRITYDIQTAKILDVAIIDTNGITKDGALKGALLLGGALLQSMTSGQ